MTYYIATSDIDGTELGTFRRKADAYAAAMAYDTPGRKAAFTKRLTGAHVKAGIKAAATRRANIALRARRS